MVVPVWVFFQGLALHFYSPSMLMSVVAPVGTYISSDNATRCTTRIDGARVCVEVDVAKPPLISYWIEVPFAPSSRLQEVIYETLPAFCTHCKMQGHNLKTCMKG